MAGEGTSLDRSQVRLVALVPYESPSTHEYGMLISSAARCVPNVVCTQFWLLRAQQVGPALEIHAGEKAVCN